MLMWYILAEHLRAYKRQYKHTSIALYQSTHVTPVSLSDIAHSAAAFVVLTAKLQIDSWSWAIGRFLVHLDICDNTPLVCCQEGFCLSLLLTYSLPS